jgi:hypothetical protein
MAGKSERSGGKREGAGRPPGTGGTPGAGRPEGAIDIMPRERSANGSSLTTQVGLCRKGVGLRRGSYRRHGSFDAPC